MNDSKISVRYAKALYSIASEKNIVLKIKEDIDDIFALANNDSNFNMVLENPIMSNNLKKTIMKTLFSERLNPITYQFLQLLVKNKRESYFKQIYRNFIAMYRKNAGIQHALITTATKIDDTEINNFRTLLEKLLKAKIELTENVNDKIIGGFILRMDDIQIDASVAGKLAKIKHKLIGSHL